MVSFEEAANFIRQTKDSVGPALLVYRSKVINFSRERLSRELGVSAKTIYRWERSEASPNPLACDQLARLQSSDQWFIGFFMKYMQEKGKA